MSPEENNFLTLCRNHDLTYAYSDDSGFWHRGLESYEQIRREALAIGMERAIILWNQVVNEKLKPAFAKEFYWK